MLFIYNEKFNKEQLASISIANLKARMIDDEPTCVFGWNKPGLDIQGKIGRDSFRISRTFRGRNILSPIIYGQIIESDEKTHIEFRATLFPIVRVLYWIFLMIINLIIIIVLLKNKQLSELGIFLLVEVIVCLISYFQFKNDSKKTIEIIKNAL